MQDLLSNLRLEQLQMMHDLILNSNDEEIYAEWIELVPDEPNREELNIIVRDEELYEEICNLFKSLVRRPHFFY